MATNLDARHLENVCRLCLTDASEAGHMLPIFPIRGGNPNHPASMVNRIYQCTSLKLEPREGIPSTICELCTVRLEDWYAFREQCLGSDEYLRVACAHIYSSEVQMVQITPQFPSQQQQQQQQQHRPTANGTSEATFSSTPEGSSSFRSSALAKRRKSIFEWTLGDGKGNNTDQKVIVEVLDDGAAMAASDGQSGPNQRTGSQGSYEPIPLADHSGGNPSTSGELPMAETAHPADVSSVLEEATWSKEYCARVNSLMVLVNGPRPYKCKICRKLFKNRSNLRRHIKQGHSDEVIEGESPPPECYDFGHIHRKGGNSNASQYKGPPAEEPSFSSEQQHAQNGHHHPTPEGGGVKRKRRSNNDPPIVGPYKCHLCDRSFKMPAHLAVHMKTHQRVEQLPPTAFEQQTQQQREEGGFPDSRRSSVVSRKTDIEPTDIIQLSDDDDNDEGNATEEVGLSSSVNNGRNHEEGERNTSVSIAATTDVKEGDDDVLIQGVEVQPSSVSPAEAKVKTRRIPAPGTIPPGPLSMKQRYRESIERGKAAVPPPPPPPSQQQQQQQFQFIVARPKQSPVTMVVATSTPPPTPPIAETATPPAGSPGPAAPASSTVGGIQYHRCHFCQQTFPREDQLRVHQKIHQADAPLPFRCRWCQKGFRWQQNYMLHVEKQTCRLLGNRQQGGGGGAMLQPAGGAGGSKSPMLAATAASVARPIVANKRAW